MQHSFDYAIVRVVPRVERGEFLNVGVLLFCRTLRYLRARIELDETRLLAFAPGCDVGTITEHLRTIPHIAEGAAGAGPIASLTQAERFHWLVSPRSTLIQTSPVHCGLCDDAEDALTGLISAMVTLPEHDTRRND